MGKRKNQADHHKTIVSEDVSVSWQDCNTESRFDSNGANESQDHSQNSSQMEVFLAQESTPIPSPLQKLHDSDTLSQMNPRYCNRKYSRRNSSDASTSHANDGENMILKSRNKCLSVDATVAQAEVGDEEEEGGNKRKKFKSSSISANSVCGICERVLRKKPMNIRSCLTLNEPSVVAVLVCGHLYHADCLEQRTHQPEKTDPSCPICINFVS